LIVLYLLQTVLDPVQIFKGTFGATVSMFEMTRLQTTASWSANK